LFTNCSGSKSVKRQPREGNGLLRLSFSRTSATMVLSIPIQACQKISNKLVFAAKKKMLVQRCPPEIAHDLPDAIVGNAGKEKK